MTSYDIETQRAREAWTASRQLRFARREGLRRVSNLKRLATCGRYIKPGSPGVAVKVGPDGRAGYGDLQHCGSVWSCPVCSAKIRQARADELSAGAACHLELGGGLLFLTLTMPHNLSDDLTGVFEAVAAGWKHLREHRMYRAAADRLGVVGYVRAVEVTHGGNGWHPHIHCVLATAGPIRQDSADDLGGLIHRLWGDAIVAKGFRRPTREHGVDVQVVTRAAEVGEYLVKVQDGAGKSRSLGMELARGDLKKSAGILPFELLDGATAGNPYDLALWREYEAVTKGRRCLTWSRGLRERWRLDVEEVTDEALANAETPAAVTVAVLTDAAWDLVLRTPGARHQLLVAAESDGDVGVNRAISRWCEAELREAERRRRLRRLPLPAASS